MCGVAFRCGERRLIPSAMTTATSATAVPVTIPSAEIDRYEARAEVPGRAVAGLTREQLLAFPVPGTWSIQQIIVHLLESDLVATHRMRRIVAEDLPLVIGYDETRFAQVLSYD